VAEPFDDILEKGIKLAALFMDHSEVEDLDVLNALSQVVQLRHFVIQEFLVGEGIKE
jgi:hypothetical protein